MVDGRLILGVGGGSASGKSTLVGSIVEALGGEGVVVIEHDCYYRDRSALTIAQRESINYDHPDSLETDLLIRHLGVLADGGEVEVPVYDYATHSRKAEVTRVAAGRLIIVEGLLVLADEGLCELFDIKVYVDAPEDVRLGRRIARDLAERGRTRESVIEQHRKTVEPMHREFVEPSKLRADIVVSGDDRGAAIDRIVALVCGG